MINVNGRFFTYSFEHDPGYVPKKHDKPRGVHGRTACKITELRVLHNGGAEEERQVLMQVTDYVYCSRKEPASLAAPANNPNYDPAMGRRRAFEKVVAQFDQFARRGLWEHFLTHVLQPIDLPAQPARRIYIRYRPSDLVRKGVADAK